MADISSNNKRIAKNTILLYFRTILIMIVSLYTSRVVLNTLGVDDYGVYNVVGGIVTMFSIISGALSTAISRYITFGLGKGDQRQLRTIFSTSVFVQLAIALLVFIVCEVVGVWFLNNKLSIPDGRLISANWVLHCSLVSFIVNLLSVPYNAVIVAHERMNVFAYISIVEVVLKLIIVYVLEISPYDKLISYAILTVCVSITIRAIYTLYCKRQFEECQGKLVYNKSVFKEMLGFAGWNFISNGIMIFNTQGVNILVNMYYGVAVNAARGIASQVDSSVQQFVSNFSTAINPQITKSYASNDIQRTYDLVCRGAKFSFFLLMIFAVPIIIEANYILAIWLNLVPEHAVGFVRLSLLASLVGVLGNTSYTACLASGKIKMYVIFVSSVASLNFFLTWLAYYQGAPVESAYIVYAFVYFLLLIVRVGFMKRLLNFPPALFLKGVILPILPIFLISFIVSTVPVHFFEESFLRFLITGTLSVLISCTSIYLLGLTASERIFIKSSILAKIKK